MQDFDQECELARIGSHGEMELERRRNFVAKSARKGRANEGAVRRGQLSFRRVYAAGMTVPGMAGYLIFGNLFIW